MRFNQQSVDPRVIEIDHHGGQYERNRFIAAYHHFILRRCVRLAGVRSGMSVLDYGCGRQMLRRHLPTDVRYNGYDLNPEFSDITDPTSGRYNVVFAIQMLMYPDNAGLKELIAAFAGMTETVVAMLPAQGFVKKNLIDPVLGLKEAADTTFRSRPARVYEVLGERFDCERMIHLFGVADLSRWKVRTS
jgi:hypothetical protein